MTMPEVFICDTVRTPVGRYAGALSQVRTDDLAAIPLKELIRRNDVIDWNELDDVLLGCANQAGEDNRNVARMAALLAGLPETVPGSTINRLCGSGMDAIGTAARSIKAGEANLLIAGGVESMSRAPLVMGKATKAFSRSSEMYDSTIGWRFINARMDKMYGTISLTETAENLGHEFKISRERQDAFALHSQQKAAVAQKAGLFAEEIVSVSIPQRRGDALLVKDDEHLRETSLDKLSQLKPLLPVDGTVTAGNASGINDGSAALIMASESAIQHHNLEPKARVLGMAVAGVPPRTMGIGPVPATLKLLARLDMKLEDMDIIEINEAFAVQALACLDKLGLADKDPRINPQGGAIALGHPLGMSGARLVNTAVQQLHRSSGKLALCTMCIGVGQGISLIIERV